MNFLDCVIDANLEILKLLESSFDEDLHLLLSKGAGGDISSKIDIVAEEIFIKHLKSFGCIYSEECGKFGDEDSEYEIIIDPIDGSDNLLSHIPYFGTSVALKKDGVNLISIVVNLANRDIFVKDKNSFKKAKLDNLIFKNVIINNHSKVGIFERSYKSALSTLLRENDIKYRSMGAIALSLAYAHEVNFVLFEGEYRDYDIEAGLHMCEDLYIKKSKNLIFVSKDKENFDKIIRIVLG